MKLPLVLLAAAAMLLSACATGNYSPSRVQAGQSTADVERELGAPTGRYTLPGGGTRLEFARGPYGKHTYMVDVDGGGRVTGWAQVLTEANFNALPAGISRDELLQRLGRPSERYYIGWQELDVWAYRYATDFGLCQWFQVGLGRDGRVANTGYGIDPRCDVGRNDSSRS